MRTLIILIIGVICGLGSCEKDPIVGGPPICNHENKPELTDSRSKGGFSQLDGRWELTNTVNYGAQSFLKSKVLKRAKAKEKTDSVILGFRNQTNEFSAPAFYGDCFGKYSVSVNDNKKWLYINDLGCLLLPITGKYQKLETKYYKAFKNATCFEISNDKLFIQYYINEKKRGKLIYKQVN
jgi:hypothetical protein